MAGKMSVPSAWKTCSDSRVSAPLSPFLAGPLILAQGSGEAGKHLLAEGTSDE